jgi:hypothetical protein
MRGTRDEDRHHFGPWRSGHAFILPAQALTISSTDPDPHTVTVKAGSDGTELIVEPQMAVEPPCAAGCRIELENGELYDAEGGERSRSKGGVIFVDAVPKAKTTTTMMIPLR